MMGLIRGLFMAATPYPLPKSTRQTAALLGTGVDTYGSFGTGWGIFEIADVLVETRPVGGATWVPASVTVAKVNPAAPYGPFTIKFGTAIAATMQYRVTGKRQHERSVAVSRGGSIDGVALEKELSKVAVVLQEQRRDIGELGQADIAASVVAASNSAAAAAASAGSVNLSYYDNRAKASAASIPDSANSILVAGATVPGKGAAIYVRIADGVAAGPAQLNTNGGANRWEIAKRQPHDVMQFGALGDDAQNDTSAIQAAIDFVGVAGGGKIGVPVGTYKIIGQLNMSTAGVVLSGGSRWATLIKQYTLNSKILNITNAFCGFSGLSMIYSGTPLSGATAVYNNSGYAHYDDFIIRSSYVGLEFSGVNCVACKVTRFEILDYEQMGAFANTNCGDIYLDNFIMNAGTQTRGTLGGIRLFDHVEAFIAINGDILNGVYSLTTDAAVNAVGVRPAYNRFTNIYFDSAALGSAINRMVATEFIGCWWSGGRSGAGNAGCTLTETDSINFVDPDFFNCGSHGLINSASAVRTRISGLNAESNSVTSGAGVAHGVVFQDGSTDFEIIGGKSRNGLYSGVQGFGIVIAGAACDRFLISGVNVRGNATGGIQDGSLATADKVITDCIGYKTKKNGQAVILSGATNVVVNHGLDVSPLAQDIQLTRGGTNAGSTDLFADTITATQFTIRTAAAPSANLPINWQVRSRGA
jgi:Pectate lyase superfamily protein